MNDTDEIYSELTKSLGKAFKGYRLSANLSMRDIYKLDNVSIACISDLEKGIKIPRVYTLIKLMRRVHMPIAEVFTMFDDDYGRLEKIGLTDSQIALLFDIIGKLQSITKEVKVVKNVTAK